jgi:tRNA(Ile)-lysidine synthetase-like protein
MQKSRTIKTSKIKESDLFHFFVNKIHSEISSKNIVLVGLSGGVDSMVLSFFLYHFFIQKGYPLKNLIFVHLNHKVRKESTDEAKNIQKWFSGCNLEYFIRENISSKKENDLRNRRYSVFKYLMKQHKAKIIFLGHHFDDRVETSLLNIKRGCWIDGFMWIKPKEKHHLLWWKLVIRPLLDIRKHDIIKESKLQKIPYVQDQTNFDVDISKRNYIRNQILPKLYEDPNFEKIFRQRYQKYDSKPNIKILSPITKSKFRWVKSAYVLDLPRQEMTGELLKDVLKKLHSSWWLTKKTIQDFLKFIQNAKKWRKQINKTIIIIAHEKIYFFEAKAGFREKTVDKKKKIDKEWLIERYPQKNDLFKWKTRNKYCITEKIPLFRRNFIPVIAQGNKIISWDRKSRKSSTVY